MCVNCDCPGYSSVVPIDRAHTRPGDRLDLVTASGGIHEARQVTVAEVDDEGIVLDSGERVTWEQARAGHVRRHG